MQDDDMKDEQKTKKGFFGMLRESFGKTGGCCCGPGETCGGPSEESNESQTREAERSKEASKAAQQQR
jgi:hypothetical protein